MTSYTHRVRNFIRLLLLSLMFPWGGLCGGREEVLANGWTLDLLIERFNQDEKAVLALDQGLPPSENWGGAVPYFGRLLGMIEKLGDRAALPFLEEKSLMANAPRTLRARAARAYASLATAEECAEFLPKILAIGNEEKSAGGWRNSVTPMCLAKIDAGIVKHELSDESMARFMTALLTFAQSTDNSWEAKNADDFLSKHCKEYPMSKQRVALWHTIVTTGNEWSKEKYAPLSQSLEAIPPSKRTDLRKRFPDLPPLPGDAPAGAGNRVKVAIAVIAGVVSVVTTWFAVRWKKAHKTA
jgi:hypothetical protein